MVAIGSSYYHWKPSNSRLVWDRLPMTVGFMSLVAVVISETLGIAGECTVHGGRAQHVV